MKKFGVTIDYEKDFLEYYIEKKKYRPTEFDVPADFSAGSVASFCRSSRRTKHHSKGTRFLLTSSRFKDFRNPEGYGRRNKCQ